MVNEPDNIAYEIAKIRKAVEGSSWIDLGLVYTALLNLLNTSHEKPGLADKTYDALELNQDGVDKVKQHISPEFIENWRDEPLIILRALHTHSPLLEVLLRKITDQSDALPPRERIRDFLEELLHRKVTSISLKKSTEEAAKQLMESVEKGQDTAENVEKLKTLLYLIEGLFYTTSYNFSVMSYRIQKFLDRYDT